MKAKKKTKPREADDKWTNEDRDTLLDMHFAGINSKHIAERLGRDSERGVETQLLRLLTNARDVAIEYEPQSRRKLSGPLNTKEMAAIKTAIVGPGKQLARERGKPMTTELIAKVLNRPVEMVQAFVDRKWPKPKKGFGL